MTTARFQQTSKPQMPWDADVPDEEYTCIIDFDDERRRLVDVPEGAEFALQRCDKNSLSIAKKFKGSPSCRLVCGYRVALLPKEKELGFPHWWVENAGKCWEVSVAVPEQKVNLNTWHTDIERKWVFCIWDKDYFYESLGIEVKFSFEPKHFSTLEARFNSYGA